MGTDRHNGMQASITDKVSVIDTVFDDIVTATCNDTLEILPLGEGVRAAVMCPEGCDGGGYNSFGEAAHAKACPSAAVSIQGMG